MELLGLGAIAAAFSIYLAIPGRIRRKRRKELGLPPKPDEDWRNDAPAWSDTRFYGVRRRP